MCEVLHWAFLYVCMPVASHIWKTRHVQISRNFLYMLPVASVLFWREVGYVLLVLRMTSRLSIIGDAGHIPKVTHQWQQRGQSLMSTIALLLAAVSFPFRQIVAILHAWSINTTAIYNVVQKTPPYYFLNKLSQKGTDFNTFTHGILKKLTHTRLCICPSHLINVTALPCEIHNSFIWSKFYCFSRKSGRLWKQPMLQCTATWIWEKQHHKVW